MSSFLTRVSKKARDVLTALGDKSDVNLLDLLEKIQSAGGMGAELLTTHHNIIDLYTKSGNTVAVKIGQVVEDAYFAAIRMGHTYVGTEHLLLAALALAGFTEAEDLTVEIERLNSLPVLLKNAKNNDRVPVLNAFGIDLTRKYIFYPKKSFVDRAEVEDILKVLLQKNNSNVLLMGEKGSGKKSIIESMARKVSFLDVPAFFAGTYVIDFNMQAFLSGISPTAETFEGKQFRVATIRKTALFPTQSGRLAISPLKVRCAYQAPSQRKSNNPFDSFFNDPLFARTQTEEFKSNSLAVTVDPLPGNPPAGFSGAVGRFTFNATVDKNEVKTGDPITLRLTIAGTGNVKLLTPPKPSLPADFEAYEPKVSEEITREGGVIRGKKVAEYLVIPRNAGARVIEPVVFSFFDLDRNAYTQLRSARFDFTILPGKDMSAGASVASKSDVRLLGEDIRYLKLSLGDIVQIDASPFSNIWFALFMVLPPLAFLAAFGYRKRREKLFGRVDVLRAAKAGREAAKRLKLAKKLLSQGNTESYHAEISKALMEYLGDKLRIQKSELTIDDAATQLEQRSVPAETLQLLRSCIERAEFARFAPASDTQQARAELLDSAAGIIDSVEKNYSGKR